LAYSLIDECHNSGRDAPFGATNRQAANVCLGHFNPFRLNDTVLLRAGEGDEWWIRRPLTAFSDKQVKRIIWPVIAGLAGVFFLSGLYFGLVSWAESPQHALELFREDWRLIVPIIVGFGVQAALYTILRLRLFLPAAVPAHGGKLMGASGTTSTVAMVACCAHHVVDVLPILGLTVAATFLAQYRTPFMVMGLTTTLLGIVLMSAILLREWRRAVKGQRLEIHSHRLTVNG
jgi:hypothetical protein